MGTDLKEENISSELKDAWSIRPCTAYKDEYEDCTSFKARFHQYFIHGKDTDCSQWKIDYENCVKYEKSNGNDLDAGRAIIKSEADRRHVRMKAHYNNTTWKKRENPPDDWAKPLPEFLSKRNENTYLGYKQMELEGKEVIMPEESKSFCAIM